MKRLAGVVLLLLFPGCWARRPVKVARPETKQPRLLALGASVGEHFVAGDDGCLSGRGKLDLDIHCLPNFGALSLTDLSVDDPRVVEVSLPPHQGRLNEASVQLRAVGVGRTTLRVKARVGFFSQDVETPIEVGQIDRVVIDDFEGMAIAGHPSMGHLRAFQGDRELEFEGVPLLVHEGPAVFSEGQRSFSLSGQTKDIGPRGHLRSRFDPRLDVAYAVHAPGEFELDLELRPQDCAHRLVVPRVSMNGRPAQLPVFVEYASESCGIPGGKQRQPVRVGPEGLSITGYRAGECTITGTVAVAGYAAAASQKTFAFEACR